MGTPCLGEVPGTVYFTVRLSRLRGFAHVLFRRASRNRRRGHPTHTFVLPPRHVRRGWELAYRGMLPTDENIRLSSVRATLIVLTSGSLPDRQAPQAYAPTSKPNPWGTTSSPTPRGMNDDLPSSIYRYPRRIPKRFPGPSRSVTNSDSSQTAGLARPADRLPEVGALSPCFRPPSDKSSGRHRRLGSPPAGSPPSCGACWPHLL